jgi:hypothetical protein
VSRKKQVNVFAGANFTYAMVEKELVAVKWGPGTDGYWRVQVVGRDDPDRYPTEADAAAALFDAFMSGGA